MEKNTTRMHVYVKGIVQGVGFRFFVYNIGLSLNLHGWVRNRYNGQVEVMAEGPKNILESFLDKIKEGPQMAQVDDVEVEWRTPTDDLPEFTIQASL